MHLSASNTTKGSLASVAIANLRTIAPTAALPNRPPQLTLQNQLNNFQHTPRQIRRQWPQYYETTNAYRRNQPSQQFQLQTGAWAPFNRGDRVTCCGSWCVGKRMGFCSVCAWCGVAIGAPTLGQLVHSTLNNFSRQQTGVCAKRLPPTSKAKATPHTRLTKVPRYTL